MAKLDVELTVNGEKYNLKVGSQERLLDTIRKQLKLTGTKEGCSVGECGACTVILDNKAVNSCMVLTAQLLLKNRRYSVVSVLLVCLCQLWH
jgi:carbon-monoxide dehydrogenase small subunit